MTIPTAHEIRQYLKGYCIGLTSSISLTGDTVLGLATISNIDTRSLEAQMRIFGAGIPDGALIQSIDNIAIKGQITINVDATDTATNMDVTVEYYTEMTDEWISRRRDRSVIPYIENALGQTISAVTEITEYCSGTGTSILILNRRPIIEIKNITYVSIPSEVQTGNLLLSTELISEEGIIKSKTNFNEGSYDPIFARGNKNIKVTYTYGYAETPADLCEAVTIMTAKKILVQIGARTGGGSVSQSSYSRNFGNRGKYTDIINEMDKEFYSIMRKYTTAVVGS